jgi:hypothetical protein|uniref:Uncharacterized protein n=1 Tax=Zea mays TaxID=4577 RepID=C0PLQ0_MAIZE|nr:unknown [Zea mays]
MFPSITTALAQESLARKSSSVISVAPSASELAAGMGREDGRGEPSSCGYLLPHPRHSLDRNLQVYLGRIHRAGADAGGGSVDGLVVVDVTDDVAHVHGYDAAIPKLSEVRGRADLGVLLRGRRRHHL